jgi:hypothetical protein
MDALSPISLIQGVYYNGDCTLAIHPMRSLLLVTGPKSDLWLVRTGGALISVIRLPLLFTSSQGSPAKEIIVLGIAAALHLPALTCSVKSQGA